MYNNFDSFFETFKQEISAMTDAEFLHFLEVPESVLSTCSFPPVKLVAPSEDKHVQVFTNEKTIAMCA